MLSRKVAIVGTGMTKFGENFDQGYNDMLVDACRLALADAKLEARQIEAAWLGTYLPFSWGYEGNGGYNVTEPLGIFGIPATRVANFCCTGMEAVRHAALAIAAGACDVALAVGVEKMRDVPARGSLVAQHVERGHPVYDKGRTAPGMFALLATRYLHEYGAPADVLAEVAVKNHYHGSLNPKAHFQKPITKEQAMRAPRVAEPLGLYDCTPTTDGAAAAVLVRADWAPKFTDAPVFIEGMGVSVAYGYFTAQMDPSFTFTSFRSTQDAAARAYQMAGVRDPGKEIQVVECHDCFTITEIINTEDLGFAAPGTGWKLVAEGETRLGGRLPVNPDGGLKACGHPVGASGVRMINHVVDQIRGRAGKMQVPNVTRGLAHTLGGPGSVSAVFVLGA